MVCEAEQQALDDAEATLADLRELCAEGYRPACGQIGRARLLVIRARQALNACLARPRNLTIVGVEQTQATQFFLFNNQGSGAGNDNSVPLVAQKPAVFRVYIDVRSLPGQPVPTTVTGSLTPAGLAPLVPSNGPIPAAPRANIDRGNPNHTLNFWLPPSVCQGTRSFTLFVFDPAHAGDSAYESAPLTFNVTFDMVPQVRVHGVLVHYTGRGLNITAPTGLDLVNTLTWVNQTYPISGFNYTGCTVIEFNGDLTVGGGGGCGTGWNQLFSTIWNMRAASGTTDVFVGLLPSGVPTSGVIGCGGGGVAIAYNGGGTVLAQEVGHAFGRAHAPCGNPGGPDPNYPTYDNYPSGSIGEFGLDTGSFAVFNPANTFDFMSYCGPVWVSPYTYVGLKNAITASPAAAHPERAGGRVIAREYLYLNYRMNRAGKVELLPSFHLYGLAPGPEVGPESTVGCEILGADGEILESHRCHFTNPHMDPSDPVLEFHEVIPWWPEVRSIAFRRGEEVTDTVEVEEQPPEIGAVNVRRVERQPNVVRVEWGEAAQRRAGARPVIYLVRYSSDGGQTWRALAADLVEPRHVVNLELLPGGAQCRFQVLASAGIRTAIAETQPFAVPVKPVEANILSPMDGTRYHQDEPIALRGGGFSPDFGITAFEDVTWTSSRDGLLGLGHQVVVGNLSVGRHRVRLSVPDGLGGEATSIVSIEVRPG